MPVHFECIECKTVFDRKREIDKHIRGIDGAIGGGSFCEDCDEWYCGECIKNGCITTISYRHLCIECAAIKSNEIAQKIAVDAHKRSMSRVNRAMK